MKAPTNGSGRTKKKRKIEKKKKEEKKKRKKKKKEKTGRKKKKKNHKKIKKKIIIKVRERSTRALTKNNTQDTIKSPVKEYTHEFTAVSTSFESFVPK